MSDTPTALERSQLEAEARIRDTLDGPSIPTHKAVYAMDDPGVRRLMLSMVEGLTGSSAGVLEVHAYPDRVEVITYAGR